MQIKNTINSQIVQKQQNFKGGSTVSGVNSNANLTDKSCPTIPLDVSKAYASPQITQGYKEIETFEVPYVGKGKLYELANGHKVILIPKLGPTNIYTSVGAGNMNEPAATKEISHLLEHLLADYCTKPKTKEVENILSMTGSEYNASTSDIFTDYYIKAPIAKTEDLEKLIKIQSETLKNTNFTPEEIEKEKDIIIQELNSKGIYTNVVLHSERLSLQNLFNLKDTDDNIMPRSATTVKNIKKEDLINYHNAFYQPKNMVTTIVGSVDENTIKAVAKYMGQIQNSQNPQNSQNSPDSIPATTYPKISTDNLIQKTIRKDVQSLDKNETKSYVNLSLIGPKKNNYKDNMLLYALRETFRDKLSAYTKKNEKDIDFGITSDIISLDKNAPSLIKIYGISYDDSVEKDLKAVYSILFDLQQKPISEKELNIIKSTMHDNDSIVSESASSLSYIYSELTALSKSLDGAKDSKFIDSITAQDIQNTAKKYLNFNKASLVVVHPQEKPKVAALDKVEPQKEVSFKGNIDQLQTKDIHEYVLPNNLRVIIDSRPGIARSTIEFDLHSKKTLYNNPEASAVLSKFLASKETKQKMEDQDILLDFYGNSQEITTSIKGTPDKTLEMLGFAAGILLQPDLSPERFDKLKKLLLEINVDAPGKEYMYQKIDNEWRKGSPYLESMGSIKDLQLNDIKNLHQQILKNAQGTVFITIPPEKLKEIKTEIFQTLLKVPRLQAYDYSVIFNKYKPTPLEKNKIFVEKVDNNQIQIEKIFKIIESGNIKDRAGLLLLSKILGGTENSKLFKYLRNEDGIAYSANSMLNIDFPVSKTAKITLSTTVSAENKENLHKVIDKYDKSLNELISQPVTQEELDYTKAKLKSSFLRSLETSSDRNDVLASYYNSFYGINYQQALFDAIDKMTPDYIQQLAKYYLTQPYLMAISGNKEILEANKNYLANLGEVIECK